jgi:ABC-type multidrug transport system permease subunit
MNIRINPTLAIALQLMRRECIVYKKRLQSYGVNYLILYPLMYVVCFGYLASRFMYADVTKGTLNLYVGNATLLMLSASFAFILPLILDIEGDRFIDYQCTLVPSWLVLVVRILFAGSFTFILITPFLPFAQLLLPAQFITPYLSWPKVFCMLFVSALCLAAYNMLAIVIIKQRKETINFWIRVNFPLTVLGGFWVPLTIIKKSIPILGYLSYANPFLYITEGLRSALINPNDYIPFLSCIVMLLLFGLAFSLFSFYIFKKRMDYL